MCLAPSKPVPLVNTGGRRLRTHLHHKQSLLLLQLQGHPPQPNLLQPNQNRNPRSLDLSSCRLHMVLHACDLRKGDQGDHYVR